MFSRSTVPRFAEPQRSSTPCHIGPGAYSSDVTTTTTLITSKPEGKKSSYFGDSKRWAELEALLRRSNPELGPGSHTANTSMANSRKSLIFLRPPPNNGSRRNSLIQTDKVFTQKPRTENIADDDTENVSESDSLLVRLREIKAEWDSEKEQCERFIDQLKSELHKHNNTIASLTHELNDSKQLISTLSAGSDSARVLQQRMTALESSNASLMNERDVIQLSITEATIKFDQLRVESSKQQSFIAELEFVRDEQHHALIAADAERLQLSTALADAQRHVSTLQSNIVQLGSEKDTASRHIDETNQSLTRTLAQLAEVQAELTANATKQQEFRQTISTYEATIAASNVTLSEYQAKITDATEETATVKAQLAEAQSEQTANATSLDELRERIFAYEATISANAVTLSECLVKINDATEETTTVKAQLVEAQAELTVNATSQEELRRTISTYEATITANNIALSEYQTIINDLTKEVTTTKAQLTSATSSLEETQELYKHSQELFAVQSAECTSLRESSNELSIALTKEKGVSADYHAQLDQSRSVLVQHEGCITQLRTVVDDANTRLQRNEVELSSRQDEITRHQSLLEKTETALHQTRHQLGVVNERVATLQCDADDARDEASKQAALISSYKADIETLNAERIHLISETNRLNNLLDITYKSIEEEKELNKKNNLQFIHTNEQLQSLLLHYTELTTERDNIILQLNNLKNTHENIILLYNQSIKDLNLNKNELINLQTLFNDINDKYKNLQIKLNNSDKQNNENEINYKQKILSLKTELKTNKQHNNEQQVHLKKIFDEELNNNKNNYNLEINKLNDFMKNLSLTHEQSVKRLELNLRENKNKQNEYILMINTLNNKINNFEKNELKLTENKLHLERKNKELNQQIIEQNSKLEKMISISEKNELKKIINNLNLEIQTLNAKLNNINTLNKNLSVDLTETLTQKQKLNIELNELKTLNNLETIENQNQRLETLEVLNLDLKNRIETITLDRDHYKDNFIRINEELTANNNKIFDLAGHNNPLQRIHLHTIIKDENIKLKNENLEIRKELLYLRKFILPTMNIPTNNTSTSTASSMSTVTESVTPRVRMNAMKKSGRSNSVDVGCLAVNSSVMISNAERLSGDENATPATVTFDDDHVTHRRQKSRAGQRRSQSGKDKSTPPKLRAAISTGLVGRHRSALSCLN